MITSAISSQKLNCILRACTIICMLAYQVASFAGPLAKNIFDLASKYTVKIEGYIEHPHIEDADRTSWMGSGFLADRERGWIVTNAHVSARGNSVLFSSFRRQGSIPTKKLYVDTHLDIAVLAINPDEIPEWAIDAELSCDELESAGTPVGAYGHPFGYDYTSTRGIISGIDYREYETYTVDAPINKGNSGGPLINMETGKVVGVNVASIDGSQNLNFAIQTFHICKILDLLREGVNPQAPILPFTHAYFTGKSDDVYVGKILDSERQEGLQQGDLILSVGDSKKLKSITALVHHLRGQSGKTDLKILRKNKLRSASIWTNPKPSPLERETILVSGILFGYGVQNDHSVDDQAIIVHSVAPASVSAMNSVEAGMSIESVDGITIRSLKELDGHLKGIDSAVFVMRSASDDVSSEYDYFRFILPIN